MTHSNPSFDFKAFIQANAEHHVSSFDYIHTVYLSQNLPSDFIVLITKLFWPEFVKKNNKIFVVDLFEEGRYQKLLNDGQNESLIQYWMNLVEITGLFENLSDHQAKEVATALVQSWNAKLHIDFGTQEESARAIFDSTGEIFVTIDSPI